MRRHFVGTAALFAVWWVSHLKAAPEDRKAPAKTNGPADSSSLMPGRYVGKLKTVPGTDRVFVVTVTFQNRVSTGRPPKTTSPDLSAINSTRQQIQQAQAQLAGARTRQQAQQALDKITQLQARLRGQLAQLARTTSPKVIYKVVTTVRDVEFQHTEGVKVRTHVLPKKFDEKGNARKYTKEEKDELKGKDKHLPGYESAPEKLKAGQTIKVTLTKRPKPAQEKEARNKDLDRQEDKAINKKEDGDERKLQVRLIEILAEADADAEKRAGRKGKGK
jgi:hypothetical protein